MTSLLAPVLRHLHLTSLPLLLGAASIGALVLAPPAAKAEVVIAAEGRVGGASEAHHAHPVLDASVGLGWAFRFKPVYLEPELVVGGGKIFLDGDDSTKFRTQVGARFGLSLPVEPSIFAHIGGGFVKFQDRGSLHPTIPMDVGLGLDFRLVKVLTLGITATYEVTPAFHDITDERFSHSILGGIRLGIWL